MFDSNSKEKLTLTSIKQIFSQTKTSVDTKLSILENQCKAQMNAFKMINDNFEALASAIRLQTHMSEEAGQDIDHAKPAQP